MRIESIKDYTNVLNDGELKTLANKIYMITVFMKNDYPNYKKWFFTRRLPETMKNNTNINWLILI